MSRMVRNKRIDTRTARLQRAPQREPYWQTLQRGLAVGYYRPAKGGAGSWWGRTRVGDRYEVEALATADDHADADGERVLDWAQAQDEVRAWAARKRDDSGLTVGQAIQSYVENLRTENGERAATATDSRLRKHVDDQLRARKVTELTTGELRSWRNGLIPETNGDEERLRQKRDTANRVLTMLKAALNLAFRDGQVTHDRTWRNLEPFKNVGAARKVVLDPIQIQLLVDACEPGLRELVAVGAQTGARLGELVGARVRDFDAEAGTLQVDGKTGPREIYLAPATILLLRRVASGKRLDDLLLPPLDRPSWSKNLHTKRFARAARLAGLDPATCFYSLRHSYISHALKRLVPVNAVADQVGTSMAIIESNYAKLLNADQRRYAEVAAVDLRIGEPDAKVTRLREAG